MSAGDEQMEKEAEQEGIIHPFGRFPECSGPGMVSGAWDTECREHYRGGVHGPLEETEGYTDRLANHVIAW